jgi:RNA polymerase sigma-70 factor, ECF subfamily
VGSEATGSEIERLYRDRGATLWRSLVAFTGDPEIASDAMSEAFAQALRRGTAIREPERWIWRASFRIAAGALKDRGRDAPLAGSESYEMEDESRALLEALRKLSPKQRAAVVLHHAGGYPLKEAAAILGTTPGAMKVHLKRGRDRLRKLLEDER